MQMQVDEARDDQVSRCINGLSRRGGEAGSGGCNPSLLDPDVDELIPATQPSIADEKIHLLWFASMPLGRRYGSRDPPCMVKSVQGCADRACDR
jgi:hypothetical protein